MPKTYKAQYQYDPASGVKAFAITRDKHTIDRIIVPVGEQPAPLCDETATKLLAAKGWKQISTWDEEFTCEVSPILSEE